MLTTANFSDPGTDGGHRAAASIILRRVNDRLTESQRQEIHRLLRETDLSFEAIAEAASTPDNRVRKSAVGFEAHVLGVKRSRGPRRGSATAGRPIKGHEKRKRRTLSLEPQMEIWLESQRLPGESFADALHRILRRESEKTN